MSSELATPPSTPPSDLSDEQLAERAKELEDNIIAGSRAIRTAWVKVAGFLWEFQEGEMWKPLGYDSLDEWLASPEIEIKRAQARAAAQAYKELVVEQNVEIEALDGLDLRKVQMALPAVRSGEATVEDALEDARGLGRRDMKEKYSGDESGGESEKIRCPACSSWVDPGKLASAGEGNAAGEAKAA